jgi:hypothetical protein
VWSSSPVSPSHENPAHRMIRERVIGFRFDCDGTRLGEDPDRFDETRALLNKWAPVQAALSEGVILLEPFVLDEVRGVCATTATTRRRVAR